MTSNELKALYEEHLATDRTSLRSQLIDAVTNGTGWEESAVELVDNHILPALQSCTVPMREDVAKRLADFVHEHDSVRESERSGRSELVEDIRHIILYCRIPGVGKMVSEDNAMLELSKEEKPMKTDKELIEGLARAIAARNGANPNVLIYESLGAANVGRRTPFWETYITHAEAALTYIQQHAKPLAEALAWYSDDRNYYENPDAIYRNTFVGEDRGKLGRKALASLPPILRGEK